MIAPQFPPSDESEVELYELVPDSPPPRKVQEYELDLESIMPPVSPIHPVERKRKWYWPAAVFGAMLVASGLIYHLIV
jgi:hypothetical protein